MAHYEYHSAIRNLVETSRSSHITLIERVCTELGQPEKIDAMIEKYIDDSVRIKKFKDKRHPKRPKSGYMLYCENRRQDVRNKNPDATFAEVIKKMASEWNNLEKTPEGVSEKEKFTQLAQDDKLRYKREVEAYESELYKSNVTSVSS